MTLNLISLATVKTQLGLAVDTSDDAITAMIPIVSADVRRIINNNYDKYVDVVFSDAADTITPVYAAKNFFMGQVVYHPNLPADTYITGLDPDTGIYSISATPTDDGLYIFPTITIAQWPTVSKMIYYRITKLTTASASEKSAKSKHIGPVNITYSDAEINKQWNYPQVLIDDLGVPYSEIG